MNNNRTTSSRNMCGGFIGGILGILAVALFPPLLPVGCLLGVLIGFYWQELGVLIAYDYRRIIDRWKSLAGISLPLLAALKTGLGIIGRSAILDIRNLLNRLIVKPIVWVCSSINRCIRFLIKWPSAHLMNKAYIMTAAAMLSFVLVQCLWIIPSGFLLPESVWSLLLMLTALIAFTTTITPIMEGVGDMTVFYRNYQRYAAKGGLHYYFWWLYRLFRIQTILTILTTFSILSFILNLVVFMSVVIVPVVVAILAVKGLYRFAMMKSHWPCFAVTCGVTILTVLVAPNYVPLSGSWLWLVALINGSACALSSEILCKLFREGLARSFRMRMIAETDYFGGSDAPEKFVFACFKPSCKVISFVWNHAPAL